MRFEPMPTSVDQILSMVPKTNWPPQLPVKVSFTMALLVISHLQKPGLKKKVLSGMGFESMHMPTFVDQILSLVA